MRRILVIGAAALTLALAAGAVRAGDAPWSPYGAGPPHAAPGWGGGQIYVHPHYRAGYRAFRPDVRYDWSTAGQPSYMTGDYSNYF